MVLLTTHKDIDTLYLIFARISGVAGNNVVIRYIYDLRWLTQVHLFLVMLVLIKGFDNWLLPPSLLILLGSVLC